MVDTNPFPRTVASITREGRGPQTHAYDDPDLSPKDFMLAVMRDTTLPIQTRVKAAAYLLPLTEHQPRTVVHGSMITIVIGGMPEPGGIVGETQSNSVGGEDSWRPFWTTPGSSYIEKIFPSTKTETLSDPRPAPRDDTSDEYKPDYSRPPTPPKKSNKSKTRSTNFAPTTIPLNHSISISAHVATG
jgi:hypothetical protein